MSQPKPGKPALTVCPVCKLAYAPENSPKGCPHCAQNPELGRIMREREREERARQGTVWPRLQGWFADNPVRLGGVVLAMIMIGITIWFWTRSVQSVGDGMSATQRQLIRVECMRAGWDPGTPELEACERDVAQACAGLPVAALQNCAREQTEMRFREFALPPDDRMPTTLPAEPLRP